MNRLLTCMAFTSFQKMWFSKTCPCTVNVIMWDEKDLFTKLCPFQTYLFISGELDTENCIIRNPYAILRMYMCMFVDERLD